MTRSALLKYIKNIIEHFPLSGGYILHMTYNIQAKRIYQEICDMINQSLSQTVKVSAPLQIFRRIINTKLKNHHVQLRTI